jgi:hypothetical protein
MTPEELRQLCERFLAEMGNGESSDIDTTHIARSCIRLLAENEKMRVVVEAAKGYRQANSRCCCIHCRNMDDALAHLESPDAKA